MEALLTLTIAVLLAVSAIAYGADSQSWDDRDRRSWWPGRPLAR